MPGCCTYQLNLKIGNKVPSDSPRDYLCAKFIYFCPHKPYHFLMVRVSYLWQNVDSSFCLWSLGTNNLKWVGGSLEIKLNGTLTMSPGVSVTSVETRSCKSSESKVIENGSTSFLHGLMQAIVIKATPIPTFLVVWLTYSTYWKPHMLPSPNWYLSWVRAALGSICIYVLW